MSSQFPWERLYKAAALERDNALLEERIKVAQGTLLARLLELTGSRKHEMEVQAVEKALRGLAVIKWERLHHL